jgi:hypothetical protein
VALKGRKCAIAVGREERHQELKWQPKNRTQTVARFSRSKKSEQPPSPLGTSSTMRRIAIIDSEDESDYAPVAGGSKMKGSSSGVSSSRSGSDSPATRLTSPVSMSTPDDEEGPRPRKRTRSANSETPPTSQILRGRSRDMVPYVEIIVDKPSKSSQKRKAVPFVEIISPKKKLSLSQAKDTPATKKVAKSLDKGKQPAGSRQLTLSRFFAPPASKKAAVRE